jgi:hypothetical protein
MIPIDLQQHKIPVVTGINDAPVPPNFEENGLGCNGAYFIEKFHDALDDIEGYTEQHANHFAVYPPKTLPFVPDDPEFITVGSYEFTVDDFAKTLSPDQNLADGYRLNITIPAGLEVTPGLQTYFAVKGGCKLEIISGLGVGLHKFNDSAFIKPGQVWVLFCGGLDNYSLYRIDFPESVTASEIEGASSAGINKYYGTNSEGVLGFHTLP